MLNTPTAFATAQGYITAYHRIDLARDTRGTRLVRSKLPECPAAWAYTRVGWLVVDVGGANSHVLSFS